MSIVATGTDFQVPYGSEQKSTLVKNGSSVSRVLQATLRGSIGSNRGLKVDLSINDSAGSSGTMPFLLDPSKTYKVTVEEVA